MERFACPPKPTSDRWLIYNRYRLLYFMRWVMVLTSITWTHKVHPCQAKVYAVQSKTLREEKKGRQCEFLIMPNHVKSCFVFSYMIVSCVICSSCVSCLTIDHIYIPYAFTSRAQETFIYLTINDLPAL